MLQHPLISPTDKIILIVSFDKRRETIKSLPTVKRFHRRRRAIDVGLAGKALASLSI